jgi:dihydroorotate dehydrogenase (NAD+) catalytic subunit
MNGKIRKKSVYIAGIKLKNPVIAASGTFGFGKEYSEFIDLNNIGAISVKGITLTERKGNPPPRIAETPSGVLNSVGLQNPGIEYFIKEELPFLRKYDAKIIANIAGNTINEYCEMTKLLSETEVDFIELNISCPNVKQGGIAFGSDENMVKEITEKVKYVSKKPLIVKLTPNVPDIVKIAKAAEYGGADAVSLINTILGMAIDINSRRPVLSNIVGGLSGPAVKPIAVRMVWQAASNISIPVIGMGGIASGNDAVEFMLAGATAVGVGTANFADPFICEKIVKEMDDYLLKNGIEDIKNIIGRVECN